MGNSMIDIRRRIAMNQPHIVTPAQADVVTFNTDMAVPLKKLKVSMEPAQDLHGYDNPWPAGGGANVFDALTWITLGSNSSNYSVSSDETITVLQNDLGGISNRLFSLTAGDTYSALTTGNIATIRVFDSASGTIATGGSLTFTVPDDGKIAVKFTAASYPSSGKCVIVKGSTFPTAWSPYTNICPISGWDGVQVWDDPKYGGNIEWNQIAPELKINNYTFNNSDGTISDGVISVAPREIGVQYNFGISNTVASIPIVGHKYYYSEEIKITTETQKRRYVITMNFYNFWHPTNLVIGEFVRVEVIGTCMTDAYKARLFNYPINTSGTSESTDEIVEVKNIILCDLTAMFGAGNEPSTVEEFKALFPADYYPYNKGDITTVGAVNGDPYRHATITIPSDPGIVYGGQITVNDDGTGTLKSELAYALLNDPDKWVSATGTTNFQYMQYYNGRKKYDNSYTGLSCSYMTVDTLKQNTQTARWRGASDTQFGLKWTDGTLEQVKADAAAGKIAICYELATPLTYTLTAAQVTTLLGTNHVWSDAGQVELSYWTHTSSTVKTTLVRRNYSPNGASWSDTSAINLSAGDFIEAKIDLSGCTGSSENVLSIGSIIDTWAIGSSPNHTAGTEDAVVHLYYPKNGALALDVSYTIIADGKEEKHQRNLESITLSSNILTVRLDKTGLHINGGANVIPEYTVLPILVAKNALTVGSIEGNSRSHATYEYIEIVNK